MGVPLFCMKAGTGVVAQDSKELPTRALSSVTVPASASKPL